MKNTGKVGNKIFRSGSTAAAVTILVTLAAVAAFLIIQAWPAISDPSVRVRTVGSSDQLNIWQFTAPQIFGTVLAAFLAMLLAVPLSIGIALFISHYAPKRLSQGLGYLVDLLAAIPSVVYGLWGAMWLILNSYRSMSDFKYFGWIPLFSPPVSSTGRVIASASLILSVMILPIILQCS